MAKIKDVQLCGAAKDGNLSMLKKWKEQNPGLENNGNTLPDTRVNGAFVWACISGHLDCIKYLVESCQAPLNVQTTHGHTPLHLVCAKGQMDCVKYLVESHNAEVNIRTIHGHTPLHLACKYNHGFCVKYLVEECDADITIRNNSNQTPLDVAEAAMTYRTEIIEVLTSRCTHLHSQLPAPRRSKKHHSVATTSTAAVSSALLKSESNLSKPAPSQNSPP